MFPLIVHPTYGMPQIIAFMNRWWPLAQGAPNCSWCAMRICAPIRTGADSDAPTRHRAQFGGASSERRVCFAGSNEGT